MHQKLIQFLLKANKAGYAGGEEKKWIKEQDGSTTIPFSRGEFNLHDNYFGGEPYGGRLIVSQNNKPYWIMVYYGWVEKGVEAKIVYPVLQHALMHMPNNAPFRGPKVYQENGFSYLNSWEGSIERYAGEEQIKKDNVLLYSASYMGGLVDQR